VTRETLMMAAVLAFSIITSAHPVKAQCAPLTLTANGSSSLSVSPGSRVTFAGVLSNCATQAANVSPSFAITSNGTTLTTDTVTYVLAARENHPFRVAFEVLPMTPGSYVVTATSSNGGSAAAIVTAT